MISQKNNENILFLLQLWWVLCLFLFIKKWICRLYVSNTFISWPHLYSWPLLWPWLPDLLPNFWPAEIPTLTPKVISWCVYVKISNFCEKYFHEFLLLILKYLFLIFFQATLATSLWTFSTDENSIPIFWVWIWNCKLLDSPWSDWQPSMSGKFYLFII